MSPREMQEYLTAFKQISKENPLDNPAVERLEAQLARDVPSAFWLNPDWGDSCNLRDPNTVPFWMRPPLTAVVVNQSPQEQNHFLRFVEASIDYSTPKPTLSSVHLRWANELAETNQT